MREGLALEPTAVLIGIAPLGGQLPAEWREWLAEALDAGATSGAGFTPSWATIPMLAGEARARGRTIFDLRKPPADLTDRRRPGQGGGARSSC